MDLSQPCSQKLNVMYRAFSNRSIKHSSLLGLIILVGGDYGDSETVSPQGSE